MIRGLKAGLIGLGMAGALALTGCANGGNPPSASAQTSANAVKCSKCEVTYVKVPVKNEKNRVIGYTSKQQMECADCKSAAENFFATGKLEHTCTHCQGSMEVCEGHT